MSVAEPRQNALPQKYISTLWKGAVIGGTMLVPGVSGGSMAMILGIYQELIFLQKTKEIQLPLSYCILYQRSIWYAGDCYAHF